jgi:hypothetical protein
MGKILKQIRGLLKIDGEEKLEGVTRVEVIDYSGNPKGRVYVKHSCNDVQISIQDKGRTLKVFILDNKKK